MTDVMVPLFGGRCALILGWSLDPPWRLKGEAAALPFLFRLAEDARSPASSVRGFCLNRIIIAVATPPVGNRFARGGRNLLWNTSGEPK